jgi:hypothetical protein
MTPDGFCSSMIFPESRSRFPDHARTFSSMIFRKTGSRFRIMRRFLFVHDPFSAMALPGRSAIEESNA